MTKQKPSEILKEILNCDHMEDKNDIFVSVGFPSHKEMLKLASLLGKAPEEARLQDFLRKYPQFLLGLFGNADFSDVAYIVKPEIGNRFRADFAVIEAGQGGCVINLVEIERSACQLFTKLGTPAKTLQSAIGQVQDWDSWLAENKVSFASDTLKIIKALPIYPRRAKNGSFSLRSPEEAESLFRYFGGFEHPYFSYTIVIGRWAELSERDRKKVIRINSHTPREYRICTYDELARSSFYRLARLV